MCVSEKGKGGGGYSSSTCVSMEFPRGLLVLPFFPLFAYLSKHAHGPKQTSMSTKDTGSCYVTRARIRELGVEYIQDHSDTLQTSA